MRTTSYSAYPNYNYYNDTKEVASYEVTNLAELTIRDIDSVGDYLDIAVDNGANLTYSIRFSLLDESAYYNDALTDAMAKARSKADAIAEAGEYTIIGTLEVTEGSTYYSAYYSYDVAEAEDDSASTPITTDELEVTANITIVYEIE